MLILMPRSERRCGIFIAIADPFWSGSLHFGPCWNSQREVPFRWLPKPLVVSAWQEKSKATQLQGRWSITDGRRRHAVFRFTLETQNPL